MIGKSRESIFMPFVCDVIDFDIVCTACGSRAVFAYPFEHLYGEQAEQASLSNVLPGAKLGKKEFVVVRFPGVFEWKDRNNDRRPGQKNWGVLSCTHCACRKKHHLKWPDDAYFKIEFSFGVLWAYSRGHLVRIRRFIESENKQVAKYDLNLIPKEFLLKKNRKKVLNGIDEILERPEE